MKPSSLAVLLRAALLILAGTVMGNAMASQVVRGQLPPEAARHRPIGRVDGTTPLNLAIGLPLRNQDSLTNLLREIYDPASPRFHQYLTATQFAEQFGPAESDYEAVKQFARAHGLSVSRTHSNRTLLDVTGTSGDVEKAFHVHLRHYQHPTENRTFFAPDAEPSLDLAVPVLSIVGLDNFVLPHPMNLKSPDWNEAKDATAFVSGSGPGGYFIGGDFRGAYAPGVMLDGAGQSVALFELDGYYASDITDYEYLANLPNVPLTNILSDGFSGAPGSGNIEVALDIDMAICMAPGLSQVQVYEGTVPNDVLNQMATDNNARQLSSSWGFPINSNTEQIYLQFAAQGQSMFQASGDSGAYSKTIQTPSDDPSLTVVGGTSLVTSGPGGAWVSENTWSGSGGGISTTYPIPSWQQGVNMTTNRGSTTQRNIPDVACVADISIWLVAFDGEEGAIGGSSAATPLWAGFMALANQQAAANGRPSIGFVNPTLYALGLGANYATTFHDITTGNNTNSGSPTNFFAVPGYDLCTGWGTPSGSNLINALVQPPDPLSITPPGNFLLSGPVGGPFGPAPQTFVLTNTGTNPLSWTLQNSSAWLSLSASSGTLLPGGPATAINVTVNSAATNLAAGSYTATVWFTNLSDGGGQSRLVNLAIVTPPVITQQPVSQSVPLDGMAAFSVGTASNALLYFQWQSNGTNLTDSSNIFGSTTNLLTIHAVDRTNAGTYTVVISNAANTITSAGAALSITSSPPVILSQPNSETLPQGATAVFTVAAAGDAPLLYQWQWNQTNLSDDGTIIGSSSSALTLADVSNSNAGFYSVVISNALGSAISSNAVLTVLSLTAPGVTITTLHSFGGKPEGAIPNGLMQDTNGNFYGTTQAGGTNSLGTIFQMTPGGAVTTLDSLNNNVGGFGFSPSAGLVQGPDGFLYGTTTLSGTAGVGTVFKVNTNGVITRLIAFNNSGNGAHPISALLVGSDGALYGTTELGGSSGDGTVFRITTSGTLTTLAAFDEANGSEPTELLQASDGSFYGTTLEGGTNGAGTVFQITTNGAIVSLTSFNYTNGGGVLPAGGLAPLPDGDFLGTTYEGGAYGNGTVFKITPGGLVTILHSFTGGTDGGHPSCRLTPGSDGNFYGTTEYGGLYDDGTVFRITPAGALLTLAQFDGYDGANPQAALVQGQDGAFYGTTASGGANSDGAAFRVNINSPGLQITTQPASQLVYLGANAVFSVAVAGNGPLTFQWQQNGTNLADGAGILGSATAALTLLGVNYNNLGVYDVIARNPGNSVTSSNVGLGILVSPPRIATQPAGQTELVGGSVVFSVGVVGDLPLSYQWQENGSNLMNGGQFSGVTTSNLTIVNLVETNDGAYSVVVSNALASVTSSNALLAVLAVSVNGTVVTSLHGFTGGLDGGVPNGLVAGGNGLLYGTTQNGGAYGEGTIFSLSTNGIFSTLVSFNGANGATPVASLLQGSNGLFYGTTKLGGSNSAGTIFSVTTNGFLATLYAFASNNDSVDPFTSLIQDPAGDLLGATSNNASAGDGNILQRTADGAVNTLYAFPGGINGTLPAGALAAGPDGDFYGLTATGGLYGEGNVFRMTAAGAVTNIYSFTGGPDGYAPAGQLALGSDGNFYGVTKFNRITNGGVGYQFYGTIFKITPGGTLTTLYSLNGTEVFTDGAIPFAGLLQATDGNFYGTTLQGFDIDFDGEIFNNSSGTVFRVTPSGSLETLTSLNDSDDGAYPEAALVEGADGSLYGTTTAGGPGGQGTVFKLSFTSTPQILTQPVNQTIPAGATVSFNVTDFAAPPLSYQWRQNGTNLAGATHRVLTITNALPSNAGSYSVVVSDNLGAVTSGTGTLTVTVPAPLFLSVTKNAGALTLLWSTTPQESYQLQSTARLSPAQWTNFGAPILASNFSTGAIDTIAPESQKFYRVLLLP